MGVLDKYKIVSTRGVPPVKGAYGNPGRNASWDWNELLRTIESNFTTDDTDLAALTDRVATNEDDITTATATADAALPKAGGAMTGAITTNSTFDGVDIAVRDAVLTAQTEALATLTIKVNAICACLTAAEVECGACGE